MTPEYFFILTACLLLGGFVGTVHFVCLRHMVKTVLAGGSIFGAIAFTAVRFAVIGAVLWVAVQNGALPLLAALAGFMIARHVVLRKRKGA